MTLQLPQLGLTMAEGSIQKWRKRPGELVSKGEILYEVETDKVVMEVASPVDGVLVEILASENQVLPVGAGICVIRMEGE
jgi:pyruvate/2-oxoglutarate dehydrogenase complex dihydrolipoamide acyltransferase (E2) component